MLALDATNRCFLVDGRPVVFTPAEIEEMRSLDWWHAIPFAPGLTSPGRADPLLFGGLYMMHEVDFREKSFADIGCWDGGQTFVAEASGASRVIGIDDCSQRHMGTGAREFAARKLGSKVEFVDANVYELTPKRTGMFDIVGLWGVIYHLAHPLLGIERACSICSETLLISTHIIHTDTDVPLCVLYPNNELSNDYTNYSGPNLAWIRDALRLQGFEIEKQNIYHNDRCAIIAKRTGPRRTYVGAHYDID